MPRLITIACWLLLSVVCIAREEQTVDRRGLTILELKFEARGDVPPADFEPYLKISVSPAILKAWYEHVPYTAQPPIMKRGTVAVEFKIQPDGSIVEVRLTSSAGDQQLDGGVLAALKEASPLSALPDKLRGQEMSLRGFFTYNPDRPVKLIPAHDVPSMFLPQELRVGVKLEDESQWSTVGAYIEGVLAKVRPAWHSRLKEMQLPSGANLTSIKILIQLDGTISETTVSQKSGSAAFDASAIAAITSVSSLSPLPSRVTQPLKVQLNFQYEPATQPNSK